MSRERQLEPVVVLADRENLVADLVEKAPPAFRQRLPAKRSERLRRAEALGRTADEEQPRR